MEMLFSDRELATLLAALRSWQERFGSENGRATALASFEHFNGGLVPLSSAEIDDLCERINLDMQNA